MTAIDINHAIATTLTVAQNQIKYVADVETDLDPSLPPVSCLPGELNQVILNLLVNAAHAIEETASDRKGRITLTTRNLGDRIEIRIGDTGPGISEAIRKKIFDPFFTTKDPGKGTGQGLAISHTIITKKHGGTINVESEPGKGATFIIRLPLEAPDSSPATA
jgi:signal transduction histidine kinase